MARYPVQHRRGTLAQWIDKGIIPLAGELVVEIDEVNNLINSKQTIAQSYVNYHNK